MSEADAVLLVVDDDYDIRDTLRDILADEGVSTAFAGDGIEALAYLRAHAAPRLILLDLMMPRCDGPAFRAEQRKDPAIADIPVVILSADSRIVDKSRALAAAGYLKKPVDLERLTNVVSRYCKP
jgi:two-component system, chemotaxis family, chemotaxis protein CheY